ncbi:unnamed protein product [Cylicostephanus goldi]|uniref:Uncharacterized protein n=1 Tax=Cylicostephanus goldi TaxID=71465 RepID=A0A3P6R804_CYLGO|nr:unnamed protein product [Cylicostephanus goldi]
MGRFGACCVIDDFPRETMKTMIPLPKIKQKAVLVILRKTIAQADIDEDLESLMLLKHKLEDFATYRNFVILRYEMHENATFYEIMRKKNVVELSTTLKWIQQVINTDY